MKQFKIIGKRNNGAVWEVIKDFNTKESAIEFKDKLNKLDEWSDWQIELEEIVC